MKEITNLTGSPITAVKALRDPSIPLWFKLVIGFMGIMSWGALILVLLRGGNE